MKALTIQEPWAFLIVSGNKRIETRAWHTQYRGDLAIHASHRMTEDGEALIDDLVRPQSRATLSGVGVDWLYPSGRGAYRYGLSELGHVIGVVELVECIRIDRRFALALSRKEEMLGDFTPGRWAWMLERPRRLLPPVEARGKLGVWEVEL